MLRIGDSIFSQGRALTLFIAVTDFAVAEKALIAFALESLLAVAEQTLGVDVTVRQGVTSICQTDKYL